MIKTKETAYINPGDVLFTNEKIKIWTVLGSCVSIILYHPESGYTGMTHAQLPEYSPCTGKCTKECPSPCILNVTGENVMRYVNCSLRYLLHRFEKKGILKNELEARLYGGSSLIKYTGQKIGAANILVAKGLLSYYDITLVHHDVGGEKGRTVQFFTETAHVDVKIQNSIDFSSKVSLPNLAPVTLPVN
ncbi:MAG: chemotaxis protein CheD [Spirochaetota bacterium]